MYGRRSDGGSSPSWLRIDQLGEEQMHRGTIMHAIHHFTSELAVRTGKYKSSLGNGSGTVNTTRRSVVQENNQ